MPGLKFSRFGEVLGCFGERFGGSKWTRMAPKISQTIEWFLDCFWKGPGTPKEARPILDPPSQGPRGGVGEGKNPSPED